MRWAAVISVSALLCFSSLGTASGADTSAAENLLLQRARYHMALTLSSLPNYTCLQTIERSQRLAPKKKPSLLDVVRIEVALVDGKELFSWPGTGRFVDTEISQMVKGGAIGTGSFGMHAKAVFQGQAATYKYEGKEERDGRMTHKWSFVVPQARSGFTLRSGPREATVGYSGAFWIDAATLDAVRLEVEGDDIPSMLRISSASDTVEYRRVRIGAEDFLLPSMAELRMADLNGSENLNRTAFSRCRQYSGESRLLLEEPELNVKPREAERVMDAPRGIQLEMALESAVTLKGAAVGDPVTAVLQKPVRLNDGVVIGKGALVHGRLTHLRNTTVYRYAALAVGIKFTEMEAPGWRVRLDAELQNILSPSPEFLRVGTLAGNTFGSPGGKASGQAGGAHPENESILGSILFLRDYTTQLRRGLRMTWVTTAPPSEGQQ